MFLSDSSTEQKGEQCSRDQTIAILYICVGSEGLIRQAGVIWPVLQTALCALLSMKLPGRALPGVRNSASRTLTPPK